MMGKDNINFVPLRGLLPESFFAAEVLEPAFLRSRLEIWREILTLCIEAVEHLIDRELDSFDALVGENRCEVRAMMTLLIVNQYQRDGRFATHCSDALFGLRSLEHTLLDLASERLPPSRPMTVDELFKIYGLDQDVSIDIFYLVLCFGLTITKVRGVDNIDRTDHLKIVQKYSAISAKLARRLVLRWQKHLSGKSVAFLQQDSQCHYLNEYCMGDHVARDSKGRVCCPASVGARILLDRLLQEQNCLLAVKTNVFEGEKCCGQLTLFYQPCQKTNAFKYIGDAREITSWKHKPNALQAPNLISNYLMTPLFAIEGCTVTSNHKSANLDRVKKEILSVDIRDAILANYSYKPEFAGENKGRSLIVKDANFLKEREYLRNLPGHSLHDPSTFAITHISALTMKELLFPKSDKPPNYLPKPTEKHRAGRCSENRKS